MSTTFFRIAIFTLVVLTSTLMYAHTGHQHDSAQTPLPNWHLSNGQSFQGTFLLHKADSIYLETADHSLIKYHIDAFSTVDKNKLLQKIAAVESLNKKIQPIRNADAERDTNSLILFWVVASCLLISLFYITWWKGHNKQWASICLLLAMVVFMAFNRGNLYSVAGTDPEEIDKAFAPFKSMINTFWDNNYFYVESHGIPDHEMMTGIVKWQQQVPIPQCYLGTNAWPIPLKPELATVPVPVNQEHFLRGAVAVAANGVPIFNPYTNTGIDALVDGQLDNFGGHSGRADDYHYHIAPLHLDTVTAEVLPIAYALDGFAIYGPLEPDGSPMKTLDGNHGHFGTNGVYHYHGTKEKPYMIGNMVGKVTEDNTMQIVPQAAAKGVRPALTPLNGAAITDCTPNSTGNGYKLTYQRTNQTYMVDYSWTAAGKYTFNFIGPTGTTTSVYNGFVPCTIKTAVQETEISSLNIEIIPNPSSAECKVDGLSDAQWSRLQKIVITDMKGCPVITKNANFQQFSVASLAKGTYIISFYFTDTWISKKIMVQ